MASFEKMAKALMEDMSRTAGATAQMAQDTSLLRTIVNNQDTIISQNKKMVEILDQLHTLLSQQNRDSLAD